MKLSYGEICDESQGHIKEPLYSVTLTCGSRATPRSVCQLWAGSQTGRCCGSGRRSAAGVGVRRASWPWLQTLTGSPPQQHSRACAEDDPRCKLSAGPEGRPGPGQRPLRTQVVVGFGLSYVPHIIMQW